MISMTWNKKIWTNCGMLLFCTLVCFVVLFGRSADAEEEEGGTDKNIRVIGNPGGGFEWNEFHGFAMIEGDDKVNDTTFNITLCTEVKWKSQGEDGPNWYAMGHIFGELIDIMWDDIPEPSMIIPREELDANKADDDDEFNTTVYIVGEYLNEGPSSDDVRKAYLKTKVARPNHAPNPVAMITNEDEAEGGQWDNWSRVDSSNKEVELIYYIEASGQYAQLHLNASSSTDQDDDNITEVRWDLDGDGSFGATSSERGMNTTYHFAEGDWLVGLMVGDGNKYSDPPLDIKIIIKLPIKYPDLEINRVEVINMNKEVEIMQGDRLSIISHVKNVGDVEFNNGFDILYEYWHLESDPAPYWNDIGTERFTPELTVNGLYLAQYPWDLAADSYPEGTYVIRATVDYNEQIDELREMNNVGESGNVTVLVANCAACQPEISFENIQVSTLTPRINTLVNITVTIENNGDHDARWVDIHYYLNSVREVVHTFELIERDSNASHIFVFSPDTNGTHEIYFEVHDDGRFLEKTNTVSITVNRTIIIVEPEPDPPKDDDELPVIFIAAGAGMIAVVAIMVAIVMNVKKGKKDDDIW
jgi:hypothetical protein